MGLHVVEDGGFHSAETEIVGIAFYFYRAKPQRVFFLETCDGSGGFSGNLIDDRAAGISESEKPRHFVVGFASGVVARAAEAPESEPARFSMPIPCRGLHVIKQRVTAGNDQANRRQLRNFAPRFPANVRL